MLSSDIALIQASQSILETIEITAPPTGKDYYPHFSWGESPAQRSSVSPFTWCHGGSQSQVAPKCEMCPLSSLSGAGSWTHSRLLVVSFRFQRWPTGGVFSPPWWVLRSESSRVTSRGAQTTRGSLCSVRCWVLRQAPLRWKYTVDLFGAQEVGL